MSRRELLQRGVGVGTATPGVVYCTLFVSLGAKNTMHFIVTMLDDEGVVHSPAFDESGTTFATHPLSGTPIVGFHVPYYDRVIAFVDELSREIPEVPYVGWDVAIAPDGPVVIEGRRQI